MARKAEALSRPVAPVTRLRQRIGQLFVVGIPGPVLDAETRDILTALHVGGVILFRRNVGTLEALRCLTVALHALPSRPLVSIDHEGGRVLRLRDPFTPFPSAAAVGRSGRADVAYRVGRAMGRELASVGIDIDFAPVLDVHSNPANPIIGDRAFGTEPAVVAELGMATARGLLDGGVIPCGKHFPGHGDTATDSHLELPVVRRSRAALDATELVPFRAAIAAGIPLLMTAHVRYPGLDPDAPATTSRRILHDLLRGELGFQGAVITDDLEMRAIADHQTVGEAAVASLRAGADLLLVCQELGAAADGAAAVEVALEDGRLGAEDIDAALRRVMRLRELRRAGRTAACRLPNAAHRRLAAALARD